MSGVFLVRKLLKIVALLGGLVVLYLAVTGAQVWLTSRHDDPKKAQAIVVMGAAQYDGVPSPDLTARLATALSLWQRHLAPVVVVTGYKQPGDQFTEAEASAAWLEDRGVANSAIIQVGGANSWQNLSLAYVQLDKIKANRVLVVTDGFHEARSLAIASQLGLDPSPVPAVDSPIRGWAALPYFVKETLGVAVGRLIGYQNLDHFHLDNRTP